MRRLFAAAAALMILMTLSCFSAAAGAGQLSLAYIPPTERGSIFYLDVSYDGSLSAAMLELDYDPARAEYRAAAAATSSTTVKAKTDRGKLTIVLGDADRVSSRLFRLTFKAIKSGAAAFSLRMTEGVDGDLQYVELPTACAVNVNLSVGSSSGSVSSGDRSGKTYSGAQSKKSRTQSADSDDATDDERSVNTVRDLRSTRRNNRTLIILGAAVGTAAALLVIFGFIFGRRTRQKKKPVDKNGGEEENE